MKNYSNIYDIDGNLIRAYNDTHKWSVEEAQAKIKEYEEKIKELDEKDPKHNIYATYVRNLANYIILQYAKFGFPMMKQQAGETMEDKVLKAMEELKNEVETDGNGGEEQVVEATDEQTIDVTPTDTVRDRGNSVTQDDLLVSGEGRKESIMDEYVQFEELPVSGETSIEFEEINNDETH